MHQGSRRLAIITSIAGLLSWSVSGCAVRPVPDPPSEVDAERMTISQASSDSVMLTGLSGAIRRAGVALRVSNSGTRDRSQVVVGQDGGFVVVVRGLRSDTYYLEALEGGVDDFLVAVTGAANDAVVAATAGSDRDGDRSPDAIDCAPDDAAIGGSRCAVACTADADCQVYQSCIEAACVTEPAQCVPNPETCGDDVDDDCDGTADDGCALGACGTDNDCSAGQVCVAGVCTVCSPNVEVCGNGVDDDCDGQVDEDC